MSSYNKVIITIIVLLISSFINVVPIMAYDLNEEAQEKGKIAPSEQPVIPVIIGEAKPYTLGKEDILQITVRNQPEFSGQFVIGPDGKIQYSFVGDIQASGLTKEQLKEKLIKKLNRFVKGAEVSIVITAYRSKNVYILGEVAQPGKYPMRGDSITLREAIMIAGLPTRDAALRRVYVIKFKSKKPIYRKKVDIFRLLYKGDLKYNIDLVSGDVVIVPATIPSEINRALNNILSPGVKAAAVDALIDKYK